VQKVFWASLAPSFSYDEPAGGKKPAVLGERDPQVAREDPMASQPTGHGYTCAILAGAAPDSIISKMSEEGARRG
jgi:hypothetical protein